MTSSHLAPTMASVSMSKRECVQIFTGKAATRTSSLIVYCDSMTSSSPYTYYDGCDSNDPSYGSGSTCINWEEGYVTIDCGAYPYTVPLQPLSLHTHCCHCLRIHPTAAPTTTGNPISTGSSLLSVAVMLLSSSASVASYPLHWSR